MSKIVRAVNAMIAHKDKISDVHSNGDELYFSFDNKYIWSIAKKKDDVDTRLYMYPDSSSAKELSFLEDFQFDEVNVIIYDSKELNTVEARDSFSELYSIVKEKLFGVEDVLDSIISKYEDF